MEDERHRMRCKLEKHFAITQSQNSKIAEIFKQGANTDQLIKKFQSYSYERTDTRLDQMHIYLHSITEIPACKDHQFSICVHYGSLESQAFKPVASQKLAKTYDTHQL